MLLREVRPVPQAPRPPGVWAQFERLLATYGSTLRDCLWLPQGADGQGEGEQQVEQQRVVGLMLKPQCGLDELRELVGSRCQPRSAPTGPISLTFGAHVPHSC